MQGVHLHTLPKILADPESKRRLLTGTAETEESGQNAFLEGLIGAAIVVILVGKGWQLHATPGNDITLSREGLVVSPFIVVRQLLAGDSSAASWEAICTSVDGDTVLAAGRGVKS